MPKYRRKPHTTPPETIRKKPEKKKLVGGFQSIWKLCSFNWIISPNRHENKKYFKPPPKKRIPVPPFSPQLVENRRNFLYQGRGHKIDTNPKQDTLFFPPWKILSKIYYTFTWPRKISPPKKIGNLQKKLKFKHFTHRPGLIFFVRRPCFLGWFFRAYYPTIWMFPKIRGKPSKWMVYNGKTKVKWMIWRYIPFFLGGKHPFLTSLPITIWLKLCRVIISKRSCSVASAGNMKGSTWKNLTGGTAGPLIKGFLGDFSLRFLGAFYVSTD